MHLVKEAWIIRNHEFERRRMIPFMLNERRVGFRKSALLLLLSSIYPSKGILTSLVTKLFHFSLFLSNKRCIFVVEKIAALIGSGNSSIFMKYRDKLRFSMAGHALRVTFESVDYKEDEHSNHVIRSFITSSVRLSIKRGCVQ